MNVVYVYADSKTEWNCSQWNCISPMLAINRTKKHKADAIHVSDFTQNNELSQKLCSEADVIVVERNFFEDTLTMVQYWKVRGKTLLAIFDDAYDLMHPQNMSYKFWTYGEIEMRSENGVVKTVYMNPKPLEQFKWGMRMVKGIQVPSVNLAKDWSKYNTTKYIHNFLDIEQYMNVEPLFPKNEDEIMIGWCGSLSHFSSFSESGVAEALRKIAREYPQVKVLISGDKRIFDMLQVKNKIFQSYVPADKWTSLLKSLDIGLAPLSGDFDRRRSWIKVLEYIALKIPYIATAYPTYDELHDYGLMTENGYVGWVDSLREMIENYPKYKEIASTKGYEFALEQSIDKNIEKVTLNWYQEMLDTPYTY